MMFPNSGAYWSVIPPNSCYYPSNSCYYPYGYVSFIQSYPLMDHAYILDRLDALEKRVKELTDSIRKDSQIFCEAKTRIKIPENAG